jgi:hypothetical protein
VLSAMPHTGRNPVTRQPTLHCGTSRCIPQRESSAHPPTPRSTRPDPYSRHLALTYSVHAPLKHSLVNSSHAGANRWINAVAMMTPEPKNLANLRRVSVPWLLSTSSPDSDSLEQSDSLEHWSRDDPGMAEGDGDECSDNGCGL